VALSRSDSDCFGFDHLKHSTFYHGAGATTSQLAVSPLQDQELGKPDCVHNHSPVSSPRLYKLCSPDGPQEDSSYKTPSSVLIPLKVYFAILNEYLGGFSQYIIQGALAYFKHLQYLIDEYEWSGVFEYHRAYFDRQVDKIRSDPLQFPLVWLIPDYQLMDQLDPTPELDVSAQIKIIQPTENPIQTIT